MLRNHKHKYYFYLCLNMLFDGTAFNFTWLTLPSLWYDNVITCVDCLVTLCMWHAITLLILILFYTLVYITKIINVYIHISKKQKTNTLLVFICIFLSVLFVCFFICFCFCFLLLFCFALCFHPCTFLLYTYVNNVMHTVNTQPYKLNVIKQCVYHICKTHD